MFINYYQLNEQPFGVTPDPKYTYFTSTHREALASLAYAVEVGSGFAVLVAKPGMGKTTLLFRLLDYLQDKARTVFVFHTQCNSVDLLRYILADMKIKYSGKDLVEMHALLNDALLNEARLGRTVVVAIDESQNLSHEVLETIRLLSDFETPRRKLLQIILCGQPQLGHKLAHPDLVQLRQRITVLCRLAPLSPQEVAGYIDHRLRIAGYSGGSLFTPEAVHLISTESRGIPRVINTLCSGALSIACALQRSPIDPEVIREVLSDLSVDSLIAEMADPQTAPVVTSNVAVASPPSGITTLMRDAPILQTLGAVPAVPNVEPATAELEDVPALGITDFAGTPAAPSSQMRAGILKDPTALPVTPALDKATLPATNDIAKTCELPQTSAKIVREIAAGASQSQPFALQTAISQHLKGKGGWLVGTAFLAASLLGLTLRLSVPGMKAGSRPSITPYPASAGSIPEEPVSPTQAPLSSDKKGVAPTIQLPAKEDLVTADAVVHVVQPDETLSGISVDYLGRYDHAVLQEVQKENADLKDPDLILVGQKVLLPVRIAASTGKNSLEKKTSGSIEGNP
jgi:general secretion pathway protein A